MALNINLSVASAAVGVVPPVPVNPPAIVGAVGQVNNTFTL
jgi:hypothetical protein